ncbi:MAG: T9SS type A sorting domain-containing protein [Bacteroidota bacterium]
MKKLHYVSFMLACNILFHSFVMAQWDSLGAGLAQNVTINVLAGRSILLAGTSSAGIYGSTDNGNNWSALNTGLPANSDVKSITNFSSSTVASVWSNGVYRSTDNGQNWNSLNTGLTLLNCNSLYALGDFIFAGTEGSGIFRLDVTSESTITNGWSVKSTGLPASAKIRFISTKGTNLYAALNGKGVYKSTDYGENWAAINTGFAAADSFAQTIWAKSGTTQIYVGMFQVGSGGTGKMYRSDDDGSSWIALTGIGTNTNADPRCWEVVDTVVCVGSDAKYAGGVRSTNNKGTTWIDINTNNLNKYDVNSLFKFGNYLFAGTKNNGVWRRTVSTILPVELVSFDVRTVGNTNILYWKTATEINNYGFEIERHINNSWTNIGFTSGAGTSHSPKEYSYTDRTISTGKYSYRLKQIDRDGKYEYSQSVEVFVGQTPDIFTLKQNYPNPFNPTTTIEFQIPQNGFVTLKVYDVLGREAATLVHEQMNIGSYKTSFNGTGLASGVYFYRLQIGKFVEMKIMTLLK